MFVSSSYTLVYASTVSIAYYTLVLYRYYSDSFSFSSVLAFTMSYHLRDRIPRDYAGMLEGQHVDDDQDEFQDWF